MRVLLAEDDSKVSYWLGSKLQASGHRCHLVDNGESALLALESEAFDVVILDRMMPRLGGLEVLRQLRGKSHPPVIVLSAVDQPSDRVEGLRAGASDYLGKPFHFTELLVRIELLARRHLPQEGDPHTLGAGDLVMDLVARSVTRQDQPIDLTEKEFKLLQVLLEHKGQTVTRSMLLEHVWGYTFDPQTNLIDVHMSKLRHKIDKGYARPLLRTIRAAGYVLE